MRKKILIRCGLGFLLGMVAITLISVLFIRGEDGTVYFYSEALLARVGSPAAAALLQMLLCGVYGALCMGGTILYDIERWPLALATAVHYLLIALGYLLPALLLGWYLTPKLLLLVEGMMTVGFFLIWLIMFLLYRAEVRSLNELRAQMERRKTDGDKDE